MPAAALFMTGAGSTLSAHIMQGLSQQRFHFLALTQVPTKGAASDLVPCALVMDGVGVAFPPPCGNQKNLGWLSSGQGLRPWTWQALVPAPALASSLLSWASASVFSTAGWVDGTVPPALEVILGWMSVRESALRN